MTTDDSSVSRRRGRPIKDGPKQWSRPMCIRLGPRVWERIAALIRPTESYPELYARALTALEFCTRNEIDFGVPARSERRKRAPDPKQK